MKKKFLNYKIFLLILFFFINYNFVFSQVNSTQKKVLIFGITGQDGTYLTELLLNKNYKIFGITRASSKSKKTFDSYLDKNCKNLLSNLILKEINILDQNQVVNIIKEVDPDEIYNLAAQSSIGSSFKDPITTIEINGLLVLYILESIKSVNLINKTKFFQALSGDIFSKSTKSILNEESPIEPTSPYSISKQLALNLTKFYRNTYKIFVTNGFLFNHESPLRPENFVSRLITKSVAEIKLGHRQSFLIGNLNTQRDWGYAKDYVEAMWLMLQQNEPDDYVISTGEIHSTREMIEEAFKVIGIEIIWQGQGKDEVGLDKNTRKILVKIDQNYYRPNDSEIFIGNSSKAYIKLGWKAKTSFSEIVYNMLINDFKTN